MNLRKLLQIEIWSKRTTRRIWLFLMFCGVLFILWKLIDANWLTQKERVVAKNALHRIDDLNGAESQNIDELSQWHQELETATQEAEDAAFTQRDKWVSMELTACSMGLELKWMGLIRQKLNQTGPVKKSRVNQDQRGQNLDLMLHNVSQSVCSKMRKELD